MTFFERYFTALDGPDPYSSLELVAEDVEFAIQWSAAAERKSTQILGGVAELRAFIADGDMTDWAHHVLHSGADGRVEFALGETRYDSGERIGTFLAVAELDDRRADAEVPGGAHAGDRVRGVGRAPSAAAAAGDLSRDELDKSSRVQ